MEKLNWIDARASCQLHGGDLASITSKEEEEKIKEMLSSNGYEDIFWFGLNDIAEEGKFVWSDGSEYSYNNWGETEPNDLGAGEDCMIAGETMVWYDGSCDGKLNFICKNIVV